jgi:uncharacterized membrane protein
MSGERPLLKPGHYHTSSDDDLDEPREPVQLWERFADLAAIFYGSPWMLISTITLIVVWICLPYVRITFDPFPYVLLNLVLAVQTVAAEILIMVSQNRSAQRDTALIEDSRLANLRLEALQEENNQILKIIMSYIHEAEDEQDAK